MRLQIVGKTAFPAPNMITMIKTTTAEMAGAFECDPVCDASVVGACVGIRHKQAEDLTVNGQGLAASFS